MDASLAPCGYLSFDDERRITAANEEALGYLGYEASELVGQALGVLLPPAVRMLFHTNVYPVLAEGRRVQEVYALLRCKDGEELPVLLNAARRERGGAFQTDCAFLAVKRRNLFERQLQRLEEKQQRQPSERPRQPAVSGGEITERLTTLGVLLAGVMHEVRNPLTYLQGNLDLLKEELEKPDASPVDRALARELAGEMQDGIARIVELVSAVGMVSRVESAGPAAVDIARVVDTAVRLVRHQLTPLASLDVEGTRPGPIVTGEESRLAQVVMNLLMNAGQALQGASRQDDRILVRYFARERDAVIDVVDSGPGIPVPLRERIFEPFYTTKPVGEGTGLGLAISRQIVASFGGSLELSPMAGRGATFRITLPLTA